MKIPGDETILTAPTASADVFVSYNRRDTGPAEILARALGQRGLTVFLDRWSLAPGSAWTSDIESSLASARAVVVLIGPDGLSEWQRAESDLALDLQRRGTGVRVVPVLIPGGDPPLGFLRLHSWVDLRSGLQHDASLNQLAGVLRGEAPAVTPSICPYRGLRPFREEDAPFFFGREAFVERAVAAAYARPITAIVGASGSGKSSAVRAGMFPRLRSDAPGEWLIVTTRPGTQPFHALAANLEAVLDPAIPETERLLRARALGDALTERADLRAILEVALARPDAPARVLLFIDQFEELYTHCVDVGTRTSFIEALLDATQRNSVTIMLAVRGDFFDDVLEHRALADALQDGVVHIGPMNADELRVCIEGPAAKTGLAFESGLVGRILDDAHGGAGTLPLLEFVLTQLWERRRGDTLTHDAYDAIGKMRGAIAQRAEAEFGRLAPLGQERLREVMMQLVHPGPALTRRRAARGEIGEDAWPVVLALADARLLVTGRDETSDAEVVEVAHEALIHHWGRLREWLDRDREFLLWRQRLAAAIEQFEAFGKAALLRGALLIEAKRWRGLRAGRLSRGELDFIGRSERQSRRATLSRIAYGAALTLLLTAAGGATVRAVRERAQAVTLQQARLLSAAAVASDPAIAALLVAELDARRAPPAGARIAREIASRPIPLAILDAGAGELHSAALSPDGLLVLTGYANGAVMVWPADGLGDARLQHTASSAVSRVAFSPDGAHALSISAAGEARVWRVQDGVDAGPWAGRGHPDRVREAVFTIEGTIITAARDSVIRIWPLGATTPRSFRALTGSPDLVAVSRDGRRIAVGVGNVVEVWPADLATQPIILQGHTRAIVNIAFDASGARVVTASNDGTVRVWDLAAGSGRSIYETSGASARMAEFDDAGERVLAAGLDGSIGIASLDGAHVQRWPGHSGGVWTVRFSPGGSLIASAGADSTARLWDAGSRRAPAVLAGHAGLVFDIAFSADGSRLITASVDGTVRVWPARERGDPLLFRAPSHAWAGALHPVGPIVAVATEDGTAWLWDTAADVARPLHGHQQGVWTLAFDHMGDRLVTGSWDGTARVWSVRDGRELARLDGRGSRVAAARFSADGSRIVTAYDDAAARTWHGQSFQQWTDLAGHHDLVRDADFSADGLLVATASADQAVRLWNATQPAQPIVLRHAGAVASLDFAPTGARLVTVSEDSAATVWNAATGQVEIVLPHEDAVLRAAFAPDGSAVVTASADGTARVWRLARGNDPIVLRGHRRDVLSARFSRRGGEVVTASIDSTARVFSVDSLREHTVLPGHGAAVRDAFFTHDDSRVVTIAEDGAARVWRVSWQSLHEYLVSATSACLRPAQRIQLLGEENAVAVRKYMQCERHHERSSG